MPDERGQEGRPDHRVELEQPVAKARQDHQRNDQTEHPGEPVERQEPPERARSALIRDSNCRGVI